MRRFLHKPVTIVGSALLISACLVVAVYSAAYAGKIMPGVYLGTIDLGGLDREQARAEIKKRIDSIEQKGIIVEVEQQVEVIPVDTLGLSISIEEAVNEAWNLGRSGQWYAKIGERIWTPIAGRSIRNPIQFSQISLEREIEALTTILGTPKKDVRLSITGTRIDILYDTKPGRTIHSQESIQLISRALDNLEVEPIRLNLYEDLPQANPETADLARQQALKILSAPVALIFEGQRFLIPREQIGSWITSEYDREILKPGLDERAISGHVTQIAAAINITPQKPKITVENGKVTEFSPPRLGRAVEEEKTIQLIIRYLNDRKDKAISQQEISLPVRIDRAQTDTIEEVSGVTELIGAATTPFTGSPTNRIFNIKNGVKFLTGLIVRPGEEFSTLDALGTIDNTTGYLPELVIKGDRTIPEFGGGLCQVSTTLFRSVLNAGLPVTARQNHSYRVSYYERDAKGLFIGPGLDATIYSPNPDFRFRNDTGTAIVIIGYVEGDKVTFELYGTSDGRSAKIEGPTILTEFPAGEPIYVETDTLPQGVTKQIETAHPGGSAIARYIVTYPDGKKVTQDFKSYYRRWPARFLVGTKGSTIPSTPTPSPLTEQQ
ncbi:MAG: VanW family protein [Candidatus Yanofskybacteria bacterium]|nr:VanW family protein [Candidatus Yanofskybacteria bacterium]